MTASRIARIGFRNDAVFGIEEECLPGRGWRGDNRQAGEHVFHAGKHSTLDFRQSETDGGLIAGEINRTGVELDKRLVLPCVENAVRRPQPGQMGEYSPAVIVEALSGQIGDVGDAPDFGG